MENARVDTLCLEIDFHETLTFVAKLEAIRLLLAFGCYIKFQIILNKCEKYFLK